MRLALVPAALRAWILEHRRGLSIGLSAVLSGVAATAFGVAPLAPDAADLPRRIVTETLVPPAELSAQIEALADTRLELFRSDTTRPQDSADALLQRLGVSDVAAATFMKQDSLTRKLFEGRAEKMVQAKADAQGRLIELTARYPADSRAAQAETLFTRLTISKSESGWSSRVETDKLHSQVRLGSGTIRSSLFAATDEAGISDAVAAQMAEIFSGDIDFHRELRRGDTFNIVYETLTADGQPINWNQAAGRVLAAEFVNNGRTHHAVWFQAEGASKGAYYDLKGNSRLRTFLASPMAFSRVTSGFAMRFHPVHLRWRAHTGIDYAAPVGTLARTVGDGVVEFAGWRGEYGNAVIVRHASDKTTLYAHLSRIDVKRGERVQQGQGIGAVGATGTATGPHLHFEFRVGDKHIDPARALRAAQPVPLPEEARGDYAARVEVMQTKLDVASTVVGTSERGD